MLLCKDETTRADILHSAEKLFQHYGLKKTTMEDIAKAMGKGKSTLYYYYCSKEEIFEAVVKKDIGEVFRLTEQAVEFAETAVNKFRAFAVTKINALQNKSNLYQLVRGDIQESRKCLVHVKEDYSLQEINLVKKILSFGISSGEFGNVSTDDLDILPLIIVSAFVGLERDLFVDKKFADLETRMDSIVNILINGLRNNQYKTQSSVKSALSQ